MSAVIRGTAGFCSKPDDSTENFIKGGVILKTALQIRLDKFLLQERSNIPFSLIQKLVLGMLYVAVRFKWPSEFRIIRQALY